MFCHERLKVYQLSIEFLKEALGVLRVIPPGNSDVVNQFRRASMSISLNIAEGAGKTGENDKRRFYSIARGSALECAAILDLLRAWELVHPGLLVESQTLLEQIAAMLASLSLPRS